MQAANHQSIEVRAYELWEAAGRPFGRSEEFWFQASTELAVNGSSKPRKAAAPKAKAATSAKAKAVVEPAAKAKKKAAPKKASAKKPA